MSGLVICILALFSGGSAQSGGLAESLPYLELTGKGERGSVIACDDCSSEVTIEVNLPFGNYCHDVCHVSL